MTAAADVGAASVAAATPARCTLYVDGEYGRSCESCALSLERRLERVEGVLAADASFRSGTVRVTYDDAVTTPDAIVAAAGERNVAVRLRDGVSAEQEETERSERERRALRLEALFVGLTLAGMVTGLAADLLALPAALTWVGYGVAYVFGGYYGLRASVETLRQRAVNIDLLMLLAATGALSIGAPFEGAMLLFLFSLSNVLQRYAIGRSRSAIRSLVEMRPESAEVRRDGETVSVPVDEVEIGAVFVVRPGDRIPLDGVVESGESEVDQASLTGESMPVAKGPGEEVYGGTIVENGSLEVRVTRTAGESAIDRLITMVEDARSEKARTQRLIDRLEQPYVLGVIGMTALAVAVPTALGAPFDPTFYRAMTLMVAASPCAVVISTPAAVLSAIAAGARQGVLFKGGEHVESAATVDAVAFDKTGTLTEGDTRLTDVGVREGTAVDGATLTEDRLLALAAAVQSRSEHHLAEATVAAAAERGLDVPEAEGFQATVGKGVRAAVAGGVVHVGNPRYVAELADGASGEGRRDGASVAGLDAGLDALADLEREGKTSVLVVREVEGDLTVLGWLAYTDTIRPGAAEMIERLRELGVERIIMLTGDNERVAAHVAEQVGVDEYHAEVLPEEKVRLLEELTDRYESVAMVGDGVNDAPALATATVGVAMGGAGTDVALETADVVLMADELGKIPYALGLSRATRRTLVVNLAVAFGAIALMLGAILTAGIPLPLAVVGHEGSTVLVSLNGLRLLAYRA
ncbi:MAG: heavy metal translocating P-type ATPase [Haloarculaceae archaeon]